MFTYFRYADVGVADTILPTMIIIYALYYYYYYYYYTCV